MMDVSNILAMMARFVPALFVIVAVIAVVFGVNSFMRKRYAEVAGTRFRRQIITVSLILIGSLVFIVSLPLSEGLRGQLLSLVGIVLSAAIALSSTTFVGNAMAGIMLRVIKSFRPGDFIHVGEHTGRVSEMGLLRTEIQTEYRDLTSLPNLFLVTNPLRVVQASGTMIVVDLSLGYDVPRNTIKEALLRAAAAAGLEEAFVHVRELGNFAISYRVSGLLKDVPSLLSARSALHETVLDELHRAGIEIASPNIMSTRTFPAETRFIPPVEEIGRGADAAEGAPEAVVFDKAEEAASVDEVSQQLESVIEEIRTAEESQKQAEDEGAKRDISVALTQLESRRESLEQQVRSREQALESKMEKSD